jgi:hypothetical protein
MGPATSIGESPAMGVTLQLQGVSTLAGGRGMHRAEGARARPVTLHGRAPGGRAWINGREVGGADARFAHLNRSYD